MKQIKAYKCDYCRRLYVKKFYCLKHEQQCVYNPANTPACNTCPHYQPSFSRKELENITFYTHQGEDILTHNVDFSPNRCALTGKKLFYNHKLTDELLEALNKNNYVPMPLCTCPLLDNSTTTTNENNTL